MPYHVDETSQCPASKPFGVIKDADGSVDGRCHATREAAERQMAALYAAEPQASRRAAVAVSNRPWSDFTQADYTDEQWARACLIDTGEGAGKQRYKLPVREPSGALNRNAVHAAGGGHGVGAVTGVSPDKKRAAARKLVSLYRNDLNEDPPEGLMTAAGMSATGSRTDQLLDGLHPYVRSFPLEDIRIRAGGDGRTVEAYAAVFDTPAEIHDQDGHYLEVNDRVMFNRAISDAAPAGGRTGWRVGVFYNHGMTIYRTPSERGSVPIGSPMEVKADARGLWTLTRYHRTALADEVLELIREGAIDGYSFQGMYLRSSATDHTGRPITRIPRGGFRPGPGGELVTVRRMESTLREYGPTPFPAYAEAAVVGMRAGLAAQLLSSLAPGERAQLATLLRDDAPPDAPQDADSSDDQPSPDAPDDSGLVADDSPPSEEEEHSSRHDQLVTRIRALKADRPGLLPPPVVTRAAEALATRRGSASGDQPG
jgi:phage head maturation protease